MDVLRQLLPAVKLSPLDKRRPKSQRFVLRLQVAVRPLHALAHRDQLPVAPLLALLGEPFVANVEQNKEIPVQQGRLLHLRKKPFDARFEEQLLSSDEPLVEHARCFLPQHVQRAALRSTPELPLGAQLSREVRPLRLVLFKQVQPRLLRRLDLCEVFATRAPQESV